MSSNNAIKKLHYIIIKIFDELNCEGPMCIDTLFTPRYRPRPPS